MAETTSRPMPTRNLSTASQLQTLVTAQIRQLLGQRKTKALAVIELLPVIGALIYVILEDVDGLTMFTGIVESLTFPFLIPLAAIFFGGPAIVDEMEGRTLTYLTLRPISKSALFIGKLIAGVLVALLLVVVPLVLLFGVCLWQSSDIGESMQQFGQIALSASLGVFGHFCRTRRALCLESAGEHHLLCHVRNGHRRFARSRDLEYPVPLADRGRIQRHRPPGHAGSHGARSTHRF